MAPVTSPPALQEATRNSTAQWQANLQSLFHHAKDRFPDVVWEFEDKSKTEDVWAHKAIVYARAPPSFQSRYFTFRGSQAVSPSPYPNSSTPHLLQTQSVLSLSLDPTYSRSPSPIRMSSPSPSSAPTTVTRISSTMNSALFSNELEFLYTGKGFGEAFEFLFDSSEAREEGDDAEENRIDKLRKDLVFMWRSRLYSDVRIALSGYSSANHSEEVTAIFSSHRFILVSRSPYFHTALLSWGVAQKPEEPITLTLPSPPFTPASLHFTLGFIYTGTLVFSHRTYDLDTALHIMRSANYLALSTLYDEVQARLVQEMLHGLFHAFLEFNEYERITGGKWGTGGCRCRQCARRVPRILEFAISDDVKNPHLERGARRALVGLFGEGWCTSEFAGLPPKTKELALKGLSKRTTPMNVFALLFASHHAVNKLNTVIDAWADGSRDMIFAARKVIDDVICNQCEACFEQPDWSELMEGDGLGFDDGEKVGWVLEAVRRGMSEKNAALVYQTLVASILLRPHPTDSESTMLSPTSHIRAQVEECRTDVLRWLKKRWVSVRQEGGFDDLEPWARTEIGHEIEVSPDDLISRSPSSPRASPARNSVRSSSAHMKGDNESETISFRAGVLKGNLRARNVTPSRSSTSDVLSSSRSSVHSISRSSVASVSSRRSIASTSTSTGMRRGNGQTPPGPRPDSKLTPSKMTRSLSPKDPETASVNTFSSTTSRRTSISRGGAISRGARPDRPKSSAASVRSVASQSTVRRSARNVNGGIGAGGKVRPESSTTDSGATFMTAPGDVSSVLLNSDVEGDTETEGEGFSEDVSEGVEGTKGEGEGSRVSMVSTKSSVSTASARTAQTSPRAAGGSRSRRSSVGSITKNNAASAHTANANSNTLLTSNGTIKIRKQKPVVPRLDPSKLSPASVSKRPLSAASAGSSGSTASLGRESTSTGAVRGAGTRKVLVVKRSPKSAGENEKEGLRKSLIGERKSVVGERGTATNGSTSFGTTKPLNVGKGKGKAVDGVFEEVKKRGSVASTSAPSTITTNTGVSAATSNEATHPPNNTPASSVKRRDSTSTIRKSTAGPPAVNKQGQDSSQQQQQQLKEGNLPTPRGATLEIGIPCIISSKRKRFKAYARYIGEVEGEFGPWVGVEVPVGEGDRLKGGKDKEKPGGDERQWNDGTWGGVKYFDIAGGKDSEWEFGAGDGGAAASTKVRKGEWEKHIREKERDFQRGSGFNSAVARKREGDMLSVERAKKMRSVSPATSDDPHSNGGEMRGLFVRPQQVLYVVDAVDSDF